MTNKTFKPTLNVPNRPKPNYGQACQGKYAYPLPFECLEILFWYSTSKNYKKAVYICSIFPLHELGETSNNFCNYLLIMTEKDYYIYYDALYELFMIIAGWKYVEFYINNEICHKDEFWLYIHHSAPLPIAGVKKLDIKKELKYFNNKWINEKTLFRIIMDLFVNETVIMHYRTSWLEGLELDIYIEEFKIGIEYQGIQHYKPLNHWGGEDGFTKRRLNDIKKKHLCETNGVRLVYFTYQEQITPELVMERLIPYLEENICQHTNIP